MTASNEEAVTQHEDAYQRCLAFGSLGIFQKFACTDSSFIRSQIVMALMSNVVPWASLNSIESLENPDQANARATTAHLTTSGGEYVSFYRFVAGLNRY